MSNLNKARIHALDNSGDILEDVDIYTSGDSVTMDNNRTLEDIYTNDIGTSSTLVTTSKKIVGAINEVSNEIQTARGGFESIDARMDNSDSQLLKKVYYFNNISDMKSSDLKAGDTVTTLGYYLADDGGGGQYIIVNNPAQVDNSGTIIALNNGLRANLIIKNGEIIVNQFGAKGDGTTDDTIAIQKVINYVKDLSKKYNIKFLNKKYITTQPLVLYSNIALVGNIVNNEYGFYSEIINITTDMFNYSGTLYGHEIYGLQFTGSLTTCPFVSNTDGSRWQKWGKYEKCIFKTFNKLFNTNTFWIGMKFLDSNVQNVNELGTLGGSDNMLDKIFIDVVDMTENRPSYLLTLDDCDLSRFTSLYITGSIEQGKGAINMLQIKNGSVGNFFGFNWFDYCDGSALYIRRGFKTDGSPGDNCSGNTFVGNLFRGNLRVPTGVYQSIINLWGISGNTFSGNNFEIPHTGDYNSTANVYAFRQEGNNRCKNITISNNTYDIPFLLLSTPTENENIYINEPSVYVKDIPSGTTANRANQNIPYTPYFDTTLNKPICCKTLGVREVNTLTLTNGATASGNITITLNGVATTIAVTAGATIGTIGNTIRATSFSGWTITGVKDSSVIVFSKSSTGTNTTPAIADTGTTGVTGSFAITTAGTASTWIDSNSVNPENVGINVSVTSSLTSLSITFPAIESNALYSVFVSTAWNTNYWITNKLTTGFTINFGTAPVSNSTLDWSIRR